MTIFEFFTKFMIFSKQFLSFTRVQYLRIFSIINNWQFSRFSKRFSKIETSYVLFHSRTIDIL